MQSLANFGRLEGLQKAGGALDIESNESLVQVHELARLGGDLTISSNPARLGCDAHQVLNHMQSVGCRGTGHIENNHDFFG